MDGWMDGWMDVVSTYIERNGILILIIKRKRVQHERSVLECLARVEERFRARHEHQSAMLIEKNDDGATDAVPGLDVELPEVKMLCRALLCAPPPPPPAAPLRADCGLLPLRMLGPVICRSGARRRANCGA